MLNKVKGKTTLPVSLSLIFSLWRQLIAKSDDHGDYVSEDNLDEISRDSISMYTCEMPEETITKMKMKSMVWKYLWLAHDDAKFYDEDLNCAKVELDVQQVLSLLKYSSFYWSM